MPSSPYLKLSEVSQARWQLPFDINQWRNEHKVHGDVGGERQGEGYGDLLALGVGGLNGLGLRGGHWKRGANGIHPLFRQRRVKQSGHDFSHIPRL